MKENHIYWRAEFARKTYLVFCDKKADWLRVAVNDIALYDEFFFANHELDYMIDLSDLCDFFFLTAG